MNIKTTEAECIHCKKNNEFTVTFMLYKGKVPIDLGLKPLIKVDCFVCTFCDKKNYWDVSKGELTDKLQDVVLNFPTKSILPNRLPLEF